MVEVKARDEAFRRAEASCLLEGLDASGDAFYQAVKQRVLAGEIDTDEMTRLLVEDSRTKSGMAAIDFAAAG